MICILLVAGHGTLLEAQIKVRGRVFKSFKRGYRAAVQSSEQPDKDADTRVFIERAHLMDLQLLQLQNCKDYLVFSAFVSHNVTFFCPCSSLPFTLVYTKNTAPYRKMAGYKNRFFFI